MVAAALKRPYLRGHELKSNSPSLFKSAKTDSSVTQVEVLSNTHLVPDGYGCQNTWTKLKILKNHMITDQHGLKDEFKDRQKDITFRFVLFP